MKNPVVYYVVMAIGIICLVLGVYWDLLKHDHVQRGLILLIVGIIVLIIGIAGFFVMRPRTVSRLR